MTHALVATGAGVLREAPWAGEVKYAANGWASLLGASVAGVVIVMQATGDPTAKLANTVALSGFRATAIGISWFLIRSGTAGEQRPAGAHMARACAHGEHRNGKSPRSEGHRHGGDEA